MLTRRRCLSTGARLAAAACVSTGFLETLRANPRFQLKYILGSCLYGYTRIEEILPEVPRAGAAAIDIWPKVHGSQREQLDELGEEKFAALLQAHSVALGCITQYKLGPFGLQDEMRLAQRLGCKLIVTGAEGPKGLTGEPLKAAVATFVERLKPHLEVARETGVTIAIENHGNNLINTPDSIRWLLELCPDQELGLALAPYHLPQDTELLGALIREAGNRIAMFYAWQHGMGCMEKLPKEQELLQLPGRGELDFGPVLGALKAIDYHGWTEVFMHPVPRGIPILEETSAVTAEINRARAYLEQKLSAV
jgi:sugar phosphate isomerase/epimerase